MLLDHQVAQLLPFEDVELIVSVLLNPDKDHDEPLHRTSLPFPNDLTFVVESDVAELGDVAELPRCHTSRFDLD